MCIYIYTYTCVLIYVYTHYEYARYCFNNVDPDLAKALNGGTVLESHTLEGPKYQNDADPGWRYRNCLHALGSVLQTCGLAPARIRVVTVTTVCNVYSSSKDSWQCLKAGGSWKL